MCVRSTVQRGGKDGLHTCLSGVESQLCNLLMVVLALLFNLSVPQFLLSNGRGSIYLVRLVRIK